MCIANSYLMSNLCCRVFISFDFVKFFCFLFIRCWILSGSRELQIFSFCRFTVKRRILLVLCFRCTLEFQNFIAKRKKSKKKCTLCLLWWETIGIEAYRHFLNFVEKSSNFRPCNSSAVSFSNSITEKCQISRIE